METTPTAKGIAAVLRRRILDGHPDYAYGRKTPGVRKVAEESGTTQQTAATAFNALEVMGMVHVGRGGQGTVVTAGPAAEAHLGTFPPPDLTAATPWKPTGAATGQSQTTSVRQIAIGPRLAELGIPEGTTVIERTRIRSVDGTPVQHKITVIPEELASRRPEGYDGVPPMMAPVGSEDVSPPEGTRFADWLGWDVARTDGWIVVEPMSDDAAEALGLARQTPGFHIISVAQASDGSTTSATVTTVPLHHRITLAIEG